MKSYIRVIGEQKRKTIIKTDYIAHETNLTITDACYPRENDEKDTTINIPNTSYTLHRLLVAWRDTVVLNRSAQH